MQRDPDLIRTILLAVESSSGPGMLRFPVIDGFSQSEVQFHIYLMLQAGLLETPFPERWPRREWLALGLTWQGYDFLDHVRDPANWRRIKAGARKVGNWSIDTLAALGRGAVIAEAARLGIAIG
jgi:hypothetical protein